MSGDDCQRPESPTGAPAAGRSGGGAPPRRTAATAVDGRKIYSTATGRIGGPDGPVAVRASALFIRVGTEHFTKHGRQDEISAVMADPDQVRAARAFEVNP